jgi:4-amino-4-deoxychorismate lyase
MYTRVLIDNSGFAIDDRIFLGEGLFETLKVVQAKPCVAHLHWQRLTNAALLLGIPFDISLDDWLKYLSKQIKSDNLYNGGIKAILSGGSAPRGLAEQGQISQLVFQSFNYTPNSMPARLISAAWVRDKANPIYHIKSVNYLEAILARRKALESAADDTLFFNSAGGATETTCANLFIIKNNSLFTPPLTEGVLPGITRHRILQLCAVHRITSIEQIIDKVMIADADAVFITNSLQGIRRVVSLDNTVFQLEEPLVGQLIALLAAEEDYI